MIISINCPDCGKRIKVDVMKIDRLEQELSRADAEIYRLRGIIKEWEDVKTMSSLFGFKP